jgi:hypothetical protein
MIPLDLNISDKTINFSYERKFNCPVYYLDSCVESSCRCSYIDNIVINNINFNKIVSIIYDFFYDKSMQTKRFFKLNFILNNIDSKIEMYVIQRICSIYKLWSEQSYIPNIEDSYYGKNIKGFKIKEEIIYIVNEKIKEISSIYSLEEKVYKLLELEYGYILPNIKNKKMKLIKLNKYEITYPNKEYYTKLSSNPLENYDNFNGIHGVVYKDSTNYYLVDGYNRISSTNKKNINVILIE